MTITLVVPIYNAEKYLRRCLDSIANQTKPFDEVILIDDGSTDGSNTIAAEYAGFKLHTFKNEGLAVARNRGTKLATSEYIAYLDADDELMPDACEIMRKTAKRYPKDDIFQFNHLRCYTTKGFFVKKYANGDGKFTIKNLTDCECWWSAWNKLIRKSAIKHLFRDELRYGEDGIFVLDNMLEGLTIRTIDEDILIHYFQNPNSLTKTKTKAQIELLEKIQREILYQHSSPDEEWPVVLTLAKIINRQMNNKIYQQIKERG